MSIDRIWWPQVGPQEALIHAGISGAFPVIFFGGARGGGKTDAALGLAGIRAGLYQSGFNALFVRRELPMLDDAIERSKSLYGPLGATWHEQAKTWRFPGGGRLRFRPLERVEDSDKFQGQNLSDAYVEEAGQYPTSKPIDRLQAALRSAAGVPTVLVMTGNPGGSGQGWIKQRFVDPWPRGRKPIKRVLPDGSVHEELFIPSRIEDNTALLDADPGYISRLHLVGSEALVKAWLQGDWSAVEGAFFDGWSTERHVVAPFVIPEHWARLRSFDWGFAAPFSVGWWAVASEPVVRNDVGLRQQSMDKAALQPLVIPRGCLVRYREWYGASEPNIGLRLEAEQISAGILSREAGDSIAKAIADTQIFAQEGKAYGYTGPTIAERMARSGTPWLPADKSRKQGWDQVRQRLKGDADGNPMLVVFDTCVDTIRTLPVMQHDQLDPEDLDTEAEDHAVDELRYACMARPWTRPSPQAAPPLVDTSLPTLRDLVKRTERARSRQGQRI